MICAGCSHKATEVHLDDLRIPREKWGDHYLREVFSLVAAATHLPRISPLRGRGGAPRLTPDMVREIRRRGPTESHRRLARHYGVSPQTISDILNRKSWARVPDAEQGPTPHKEEQAPAHTRTPTDQDEKA